MTETLSEPLWVLLNMKHCNFCYRGWCAKLFSCLTQLKVMLGWVALWLSWGFDNFFMNNYEMNYRLAVVGCTCNMIMKREGRLGRRGQFKLMFKILMFTVLAAISILWKSWISSEAFRFISRSIPVKNYFFLRGTFLVALLLLAYSHSYCYK